jgi:hypothetical protein
MLASIALTPSWQVEKSIARGRSGFSIIWGPVNLSGPRVLRLDLGHPEKETTTTMAIEIDRITPILKSKDYSCSPSDTRTVRILNGKVYKDRHMELWVSYI